MQVGDIEEQESPGWAWKVGVRENSRVGSGVSGSPRDRLGGGLGTGREGVGRTG